MMARLGNAALACAALGIALLGSGCPRPVCGDNRLDETEQCDDGNLDDNDTCTSLCRFNVCGDALLGPVEECDDGEALNSDTTPDACRVLCLLPACGDGVIDPVNSEECDDGNTTAGDGCTPTCQDDLASCGNGTIDAGEECDNGPLNSDTTPDACRTTCALPACGDAVVDAAEECDDGNLTAGDGCDDLCQAETGCGNGVVDGAEECDDDNVVSGDGCSAACVDEFCGDGILNDAGAEACEPPAPGGGCDAACQVEADACGAGVTLAQIFPGSTTGATTGTGAIDLACGPSAGAGEAVYYFAWDGFSGPADLVFSLSGTATTFDSVLAVRASPCTGGAELGCDDAFPGNGGEVVEVLEAAAGTYFVIVDGWGGMTGDFVLDLFVRPVVPAGGACDLAGLTDRCVTGLTCIDSPIGPTCTDAMMMACMAATVLAAPSSTVGLVDSADPDVFGWNPAGACGSVDAGSGEDVYAITLTDPQQDLLLFVDPAATDFDTVLYVRSPACNVATDELGCADAVGLGNESLALLDLAAGTYYVIVDGWNGDVGTYQLDVSVRLVNGAGGACDPAGLTARCSAGLNCVMSICAAPACGDGIPDPGEECDDGNTMAGDGCSATCTVEATPEVEPNDLVTDLGVIDVTATTLFSGALGLADVDRYRIVLTTYADVSIFTGTDAALGCSGLDSLDATLTDAALVLATDPAAPGDECGAIDPATATGARALPPGTYYAVIEESGNDAAVGAYFVSIVVKPVLVINEYVPSADGDWDCNGVVSSTADEFLEIVNVGAGALDVSAWTYFDSTASPRLTFPAMTVVPPMGVLLVFSGSTTVPAPPLPACSWPASVLVFQVNAMGVINNASEMHSIRDAAGTIVTSVTTTAVAGPGPSFTLSPDLGDADLSQTVAGPYVLHTGVAATGASPGTRADGTPF